jgi:hypothetical protein
MLSPRVLYYNEDGISWHCISSKATESDPNMVLVADEISHFQKKFLRPVTIQGPNGRVYKARTVHTNLEEWHGLLASGDADPLVMDTRIKSGWQHVAEEFSVRDLSFKTDRLAALLGIAEDIEGSVADHFAAGLWEKNLPYDLLWSTNAKCERLRIAPSWSWASVTGAIKFPDRLDGVRASCKNISVSITGSPSRRRGTLSVSGSLRTARTRSDSLLEALCSYSAQIGGSFSFCSPKVKRLTKNLELTKLKWYPDEYLPPGSPVVLLELARTFHPDIDVWIQREIYFLGLVHALKGWSYRRVGIGVYEDDLFRLALPQNLPSRMMFTTRGAILSKVKDKHMRDHVKRGIPIRLPQGLKRGSYVYWPATSGRVRIV